MLRRAQAFVDGLRPDDWLAVLSFEHHLDAAAGLHAGPRRRPRRARPAAAASRRRPRRRRASDGPHARGGLRRAAGRRAASMEQALLVTARALDRVPGAKSLVILGHGFGRILIGDGRAPAVGVDDEYREAAQAAGARAGDGVRAGRDAGRLAYAGDRARTGGGRHRRLLPADARVSGPRAGAARRRAGGPLRAELREARAAGRRTHASGSSWSAARAACSPGAPTSDETVSRPA